MDKVMKIEGTYFEHSVPVPSLKILTIVNFFCVFSTSFVSWYKKTKSLKNNFFRVYANAGIILFIATMLDGFIIRGIPVYEKN
jgi:hypothetical protein